MLAAALAAVLTGCQSTAVIVTIDADAALRARADGWSFEVVNDRGTRVSVPLEGAPSFPRRFTVTPSMMDEGTFVVEGTLTERASPIGTQRLRTSFVAGAIRHARLYFSEDCARVTCGELLTCAGGTCVEACIEAGASVGEMSRRSCGGMDGGVDVGSDGGELDAGELDSGELDVGPDVGAARVPGTILAYDFREAAGATMTAACANAPPPTGIDLAAFSIPVPAGAVLGGGNLEVEAPDVVLEARTGLAALKCLFDDVGMLAPGCRDFEGFTLEAWVTPSALMERVPIFSINSLHEYQSLGLFLSPLGLQSVLQTCNEQNGRPEYRAPRAILPALVHLVFVHEYLAETSGALDAGGADGGIAPAMVDNESLYIDGRGFRGFDLENAEDGNGVCAPSLIPRGSRPGAAFIWTDVTGLRLGSRVGLASEPEFVGTFHLVAVYDRPLTPAEVDANFRAGPDADPCAP